jgi:hypothetical protein
MTLRQIQKLQLIWIVLGLGYNALSYRRLITGNSLLAPTDPLTGAIFMAICGAIILSGLAGAKRVYKFIIPVLTLILIYSGVFVHANAYWENASLPDYASTLSWFAAVSINIYGVAILALGSLLAFHQSPHA